MSATPIPAHLLDSHRSAALALVWELEPRILDCRQVDTVNAYVDIVSTYVRQAVTDLSSSVHTEALTEMAARLAHHRLQSGLDDTHTGTASRTESAARSTEEMLSAPDQSAIDPTRGRHRSRPPLSRLAAVFLRST